jgi:hypothetical protein
MLMMDPLGDDEARDPRASTINIKKHQRWSPWEAVSEIREHPPSTLRNIDDGPPWEAVPEIQKRSPSTLRNIDCGTLGGDDEDPGAPTINDRNIDGGPPGRR